MVLSHPGCSVVVVEDAESDGLGGVMVMGGTSDVSLESIASEEVVPPVELSTKAAGDALVTSSSSSCLSSSPEVVAAAEKKRGDARRR